MTTVLMPGQAPAAGFDAPLALLDACHRRIERMLDLLARLEAHLAEHGADVQAREAAADVMRYFDQAAPLHHEDEERHLLPRLREAGEAALADRMADDHRRMRAGWDTLRVSLAAVAGGRAVPLEGRGDFDALHRAHLALEDGRAFPLAMHRVEADAAAAMGAEMAARRGLRPPGVPG